jgi:hypothetical protein
MRTPLLVVMLAAAALAQDKGSLPLPSSGNVTLPMDEYNKLVEMAAKPPKKPDAAPTPYSLKHASLKFQVAADCVSGTIQLEGEIFSKGATKVPLVSGLTITDAQQKGKDLPLEQEGGTHTAVLSGPAEFSVTLSAALALNIEPGRASFNLPVLSAGTVQLTLTIPGDHTNVYIRQGLITSRTSTGGQTTIEATLVPGPDKPALVWWATREAVAPPAPKEVRFLSDVKTLVSVSESQLAMAALTDITVMQGEPSQFEFEIPAGYEITGSTGATLESSEVQNGVLTLKVTAPGRSHQFLVSMEKTIGGSKADVTFLKAKGSQRETGEVLIEGEGTIELTAAEHGSLKRMDLREISPYLRSLAHASLETAFRYHRQPAETPGVALEWVRFPDSSVLAAVAQQAVVTTLVTSEGRSLTEVRLTLKNQAQPFLKVGLPAGTTILSADVAGEKVKPVEGSDGNRVPLLRPGFRPTDSYTVSFVFMHSGSPFAKKGGSELVLPKMDIPIGLLQWEVFLPARYKVQDFGGDVISARLLPAGVREAAEAEEGGYVAAVENSAAKFKDLALSAGQLGGYVVDPSGAVIAGANVTVVNPATGATMNARSDDSGRWMIANMPSGRVKITADAPGFNRTVREVNHEDGRPDEYNFALQVGSVSESVEVSAAAVRLESAQIGRDLKKNAAAPEQPASANVLNLQRRVAGVLPIPVDVPRAGNSFRFVRPLVLDEETKVTFSYRTK